jgi:hypothetical protein
VVFCTESDVFLAAFFEEAPVQAFGIVDRVWFESRLRAHFNNSMPDDPSYYALRNIVWATGSRIVLSKTTNSFSETWKTSWAWFENALSVHTEVIFLGSFMTAVQVLILMVRTVRSKLRSNRGAVVLNSYLGVLQRGHG